MFVCTVLSFSSWVAGFLDFVHRPEFYTTVWKQDLFPSLLQWLGLALSKGPNRVDVSLPLPDDRNKSCFQNVVLLVFKIPDDGQSPETQWLWALYAIVRAL
jgi:hypothetical protein